MKIKLYETRILVERILNFQLIKDNPEIEYELFKIDATLEEIEYEL